MKYKVLPLKGFKSLRALNAFSTLLLGMKMLPAYAGMPYEEFHAQFVDMDEAGKEKILREAALFVELQKEEIEAISCFCVDPNGVPFGASNIKNLGPDELVDMIVSVCMEIGRIKIDILTEDEKKVPEFSVDIRGVFLRHPDRPLDEVLNLAFFEAYRNEMHSMSIDKTKGKKRVY